MKTTFLLVRHGMCDPVGKYLAGRAPGVHLNSEGQAQVEKLAGRLKELPIKAIYSSPMERTRESAEPLARSKGLTVETYDGLNEFNFGTWTGKNFDELNEDERWKRFNVFRSATRPIDGELVVEVQMRMVRSIESFRKWHKGELVAVFSHSDPLKALIAYYLGAPLELMSRLELLPASVSILELDAWNAKILRLNDTGELPGLF